MRTEMLNGRRVLCGIFPASELKVGQEWAQADGTDRAVVIRELEPYGPTELGQVAVRYGQYGNDTTYEKDSFSFQCRYVLVEKG